MQIVEHSQLQFSLILFLGTLFALLWLQSHYEALFTKQEMRTDEVAIVTLGTSWLNLYFYLCTL